MHTKSSTPESSLDTLGSDASDAAWRIAAGQLLKLTRAPLVATLSRNLGPGDEALRARIAAFLETELGTALLTALVSAGLSALPALSLPGVGVQAVPRLARELRVKAMADAADFTADLVMGPLRESLSMWIQTAGTEPDALDAGETVSAFATSQHAGTTVRW